MEGLIDLEIAGDLDRKIFLAFLKGLSQVKFKNQFAKVQAAKAKQRGNTATEAESSCSNSLKAS